MDILVPPPPREMGLILITGFKEHGQCGGAHGTDRLKLPGCYIDYE